MYKTTSRDLVAALRNVVASGDARITLDVVNAIDDHIQRLEKTIERQRQNARETWEAMVAFRNTLNEYVAPMPSLESDLLQGPEASVFFVAMARAIRKALHWTTGVEVKPLDWRGGKKSKREKKFYAYCSLTGEWWANNEGEKLNVERMRRDRILPYLEPGDRAHPASVEQRDDSYVDDSAELTEETNVREAGVYTARGVGELHSLVHDLAQQGFRIVVVIDTQNGDYHVVAQREHENDR